MKHAGCVFALFAAWLAGTAVLARDLKQAVEAPVVSRYEGSGIYRQGVKSFDEVKLLTRDAAGKDVGVAASGRRVWTVYVGLKGRSGLEVFRSYQQALGEAGFRTLYTCSRKDCGMFFHRATQDLRSDFMV